MKAARNTDGHGMRISRRPASGDSGSAALYIWGAIALASLTLAIAIAAIPSPISLLRSAIDPAQYQAIEDGEIESGLNDVVQKNHPTELPSYPKALGPSELTKEKLQLLDQLRTGTVRLPEVPNLPQDPSEFVVNLPVGADFAADLGSAGNPAQLELRYHKLSRRYGNLLHGLHPRIKRGPPQEIRLLMGPFASRHKAEIFCRALLEQETGECKPARFEGSRIDVGK